MHDQVNNLVSDFKFFWEAFVTLVVITDPPGVVPVFLGMTSQRPKTERNRLAWQAAVVALGVIVAFAAFGRSILTYLGVELPSLQAAGGLLLLLVALQLLTGQASEPSDHETGHRQRGVRAARNAVAGRTGRDRRDDAVRAAPRLDRDGDRVRGSRSSRSW